MNRQAVPGAALTPPAAPRQTDVSVLGQCWSGVAPPAPRTMEVRMTWNRLMTAAFAALLLAACADQPTEPDPLVLPEPAALDRTDGLDAVEQPGPFPVGYRVENAWVSPDRPARIHYWYPAQSSQGPVAVYRSRLYGVPLVPGVLDPIRFEVPASFAIADAAPAAGPFPAVVASHSWTGLALNLGWMGEHLGSHGFVVAAIDHQGSSWADEVVDFVNAAFGPTMQCLDSLPGPCLDWDEVAFHQGRSQDLIFLFDVLEGSVSGTGEFLAGHVDPRPGFATTGFSSGADAALLAASGFTSWGIPPDPRVAAVLTMGVTEGLDLSDLAGVGVPTLLSIGSDDVSAPPDVTRTYFDAISSSPRWMTVLDGATHSSYGPVCDIFPATGKVALESVTAPERIMLQRQIGSAVQVCPYHFFVDPVDLTGLIEQLTGVVVTPTSVPTHLAAPEARRITNGHATAFFKGTIGGRPEYLRYLQPQWAEPPTTLTRCFETPAGTFCEETGSAGYDRR
jgi:predicted dienelactone hydrolase